MGTASLGKRIHNRNLLNAVFGRWTVLDVAPRTRHGAVRWHCRCSCGTEKDVYENSLIRGISMSCGCMTREVNSQRQKHGESHLTRLYRTWCLMRRRCNNPHSSEYAYYGARGISVCARWNEYANFRSDMGPHPGADYSIDRIDNDGNYNPENCRWATRSQQQQNQGVRTCAICAKACRSGAGLKLHQRIHTAGAGHVNG